MQEKHLKQIVASLGPLSGKSIKDFHQVSGGCIDQAWKLNLEDGKPVFLKTAPPESFERHKFEATGLIALKNFANENFLLIPEPLAIQKLDFASVLLLPWLEISAGNQKSLGRGLAELHKLSAAKSPKSFGWGNDGFIGSGPQPAGWNTSWGKCFVQLRLFPQLKLATSWGLKINQGEKLMSMLIAYLNRHQPIPSLVHGDLWSGNVGNTTNGKGILIDPATWWADREVDLAMTKLFGGFTKEFYIEYEKTWPLPKNSLERVEIYNLYHLLNHANLFGSTYKSQCIDSLKKIERILFEQ